MKTIQTLGRLQNSRPNADIDDVADQMIEDLKFNDVSISPIRRAAIHGVKSQSKLTRKEIDLFRTLRSQYAATINKITDILNFKGKLNDPTQA